MRSTYRSQFLVELESVIHKFLGPNAFFNPPVLPLRKRAHTTVLIRLCRFPYLSLASTPALYVFCREMGIRTRNVLSVSSIIRTNQCSHVLGIMAPSCWRPTQRLQKQRHGYRTCR